MGILLVEGNLSLVSYATVKAGKEESNNAIIYSEPTLFMILYRYE